MIKNSWHFLGIISTNLFPVQNSVMLRINLFNKKELFKRSEVIPVEISDHHDFAVTSSKVTQRQKYIGINVNLTKTL